MRVQIGLWVALVFGVAACPAGAPIEETGGCGEDDIGCCGSGEHTFRCSEEGPYDGTDDGPDGDGGTDVTTPECVTDSDCKGLCGYCDAGVCEDSVGCCGFGGDDNRFRCSQEDSWTGDGDGDGDGDDTGTGSEGSGSGSGSEGSGSGTGSEGGGSGSDSGTESGDASTDAG